MKVILIELQLNAKNELVFVARDPRSGQILYCGTDVDCLSDYLASLTKE